MSFFPGDLATWTNTDNYVSWPGPFPQISIVRGEYTAYEAIHCASEFDDLFIIIARTDPDTKGTEMAYVLNAGYIGWMWAIIEGKCFVYDVS